MSLKCSEIFQYLESLAPKKLAEEWDNTGLMVGGAGRAVKKVLVCLDVTPDVAEEAIISRTDLIISHHPLIFKALKKISDEDSKGLLIHKLIKHDIGVYSLHTNLDFAMGGLNDWLAEKLGLQNIQILKEYKSEKLYKLVVFVPGEAMEKVREALCQAGAGCIGNYSDCTFMTQGIGTFRPLEGATPYIGTKSTLEKVDEYRLETIIPEEHLNRALKSMLEAHPYEEAAYDIYPLEIKGKAYGLGRVGELQEGLNLESFAAYVKGKIAVSNLRIAGMTGVIKKVGVFCGAFDDGLVNSVANKCDILVTGDVKHHSAVDAVQAGICVMDAGHFGTERIIVEKLAYILSKRFPGIEVVGSTVEKDPFIYY
ncbi:MAG: Nif3-like dinuclear metal center hexameric protein [Clostridia bacterium]|nr:Nif3-like dinuclear metal center hexameric protein [Clostridia bacterium]